MGHWHTAFCETNGICIYYTRTGGMNLPPIVMLHGLMMNGACWTGLAHSLEKNYDLILPDARGHGKSSIPEFGYRYNDHANDVIGLITSLEIPSPILLGHSMGGMTAAVVASRKPHWLRALILVDPTFLSSKSQRKVRDSDVANHHQKMLNMSREELVADARMRHPDRTDDVLDLLALARLQTSMAAFDVLTPPSPDYRKLIPAIDVPSFIVFGDKGVISSAMAEELKRMNPTIQTKMIREAGHSVHLDQPKQVASTIRTFLHSIGAIFRI